MKKQGVELQRFRYLKIYSGKLIFLKENNCILYYIKEIFKYSVKITYDYIIIIYWYAIYLSIF